MLGMKEKGLAEYLEMEDGFLWVLLSRHSFIRARLARKAFARH
jgi:hypothetical protein